MSLSPTTSPSTCSSNVTEQNENRSDYQPIAVEYVDKNANNIGGAADDGKPLREGCDRLANLVDKLHIDDGKGPIEGQISTHNHIGAAAVAPALLLANHISPPILSDANKLRITDVNPEV